MDGHKSLKTIYISSEKLKQNTLNCPPGLGLMVFHFLEVFFAFN